MGCDGTNVNTCWKNGAIRRIEKKLGRPVQWFICLLHFIELPLRALFLKIDGQTDGPNSFSGPIGKGLKYCLSKPVVNYKKIHCNLPDIDLNILSHDQRYLFKICQAIQSGTCSEELSASEPGTLNHARWLTCANRILRSYISEPKPSEGLKLLVEFILKVYASQWFSIRKNKSVKDGSRHFFKTIELTRYLPSDYLEVVNESIRRNAYFAMPENILLSMMTDEDVNVRQEALTKIIDARQLARDGQLSASKLAVMNFHALHYKDMIDWSSINIIFPPVIRAMSNEELEKKLLSNNVCTDWEFCAYPCHTVAVERLVKLVTEASLKVCGHDNRDGFIRATLASRQQMKKFDTKKNFSSFS